MPTIPHDVFSGRWVTVVPASASAQNVDVTLLNSGPVVVRQDISRPDDAVSDGLPLLPGSPELKGIELLGGESLYAKGIQRNSRISTMTTEAQGSGFQTSNGWADYSDTEYTETNKFFVPKNTDVIIPNNGLGGNRSQEPSDRPFFENGKILGRVGDSLAVTTSYQIETDANKKNWFEMWNWWSIGGPFGRIRPRVEMRKGNNNPRPVSYCLQNYNLAVWEANGADTFIRTTLDCWIWDIEFMIERGHAGVSSEQ